MPHQMKFFLDPLEIIREYRGCMYHKSKSKLESLELGCVWKFMTGNNLNGAHDSLVDVKAQTDIVISKHFVNYLDKSKSVRLIENIFSKSVQSAMAKKLEPTRPVHEPWFELDKDSDFTCHLSGLRKALVAGERITLKYYLFKRGPYYIILFFFSHNINTTKSTLTIKENCAANRK